MLITRHESDKREERTIRQLLAQKAKRKVTQRLKRLHPADIAEYLEDFDEQERKAIFSAIDDELAVKIIQTMDDELQYEIVQVLGKDRLINILDALPSDEVVDILSQFSNTKVQELLEAMEDEEAEEAKTLMEYDEESAGGIMSADVIYFDKDMTVAACVEKIRANREDLENLSYLYVTDANKKLVGIVTVKDLVLADEDTPLSDLMHDEPLVAVRLGDDQEEVAKIVAKYDLLAVPVVDVEDRLVGIVHVDDIIDVIEDEATEDMYRMVGMDEDAESEDNSVKQMLSRIRWLIATMVGSLTAGAVIKTLSPANTALAAALSAFIPAIMGLGGGVAIQSATRFIRGLATGEIEEGEFTDVLKSEAKVALLLGLAIAAILFTASLIWQGVLFLSLIIAVTLVTQCLFAVLVGLLIPMSLNSVGIDPAVAAGPLTQMTCDITGMIIYFTYANLAVSMWGDLLH